MAEEVVGVFEAVGAGCEVGLGDGLVGGGESAYAVEGGVGQGEGGGVSGVIVGGCEAGEAVVAVVGVLERGGWAGVGAVEEVGQFGAVAVGVVVEEGDAAVGGGRQVGFADIGESAVRSIVVFDGVEVVVLGAVDVEAQLLAVGAVGAKTNNNQKAQERQEYSLRTYCQKPTPSGFPGPR